mgnify:FL=1
MEKKKNNTELDLDEDGIPKLEYIQVGEFLLPNLSLEKVDGYIGRWGITVSYTHLTLPTN